MLQNKSDLQGGFEANKLRKVTTVSNFLHKHIRVFELYLVTGRHFIKAACML
jgi:hypothetical protein